jgi:uncharacterized protein YceK
MKASSSVFTTVGFALALTSCATVGTLSESETKNKVYSGTLRHFELKCAHAVCLDFPFSLLADTLALPVTLPWSLVNLMRSDAAQTAQPAQ